MVALAFSCQDHFDSFFTYFSEDGIFTLVYMLGNYDTNTMLGIHVDIDRDHAEMDSIHTLWAQAWTYQRELREMFGIDFPGSPRVDEDFILEDWVVMRPYRRDFDTLKYSQESYVERPGRETHDPAMYMKLKLYPDEGNDG